MKKNSLRQLVVLSLYIITASLIVASCDSKTSEPKTEDPSQIAEEENDAKFDNKKLEKDAQFLVDATTSSLEVIKLGNIAQERGSDAEIKKLGKHMAEEHTKFLKEVNDLAKTKQVSIPDSISNSTKETVAGLNSKGANDFDKAYCERLVEEHKKTIAIFEKEAADSRDQDLKQWAAAKLPDLRKHLDGVFEVQKKIEKK